MRIIRSGGLKNLRLWISSAYRCFLGNSRHWRFVLQQFLIPVDDSWIGWQDGRVPRMAYGTGRDGVQAALAAARTSDAEPGVGELGSGLLLRIEISAQDGLPSHLGVLKQLAKLRGSEVTFHFVGDDGARDTSLVIEWLDRCGAFLQQTGANVAMRACLETELVECLPTALREYASKRVAWFSVIVRDASGDMARSRASMDHAAELTDLGVRTDTRIVLDRRNQDSWMSMADAWSLATHGGRMLFDAGNLDDSEEERAGLAEFLGSVFECVRFDLWKIEPLATLMRVISLGSGSSGGCGSLDVGGFSSRGFVHRCRNGRHACGVGTAARSVCECCFAPVCAALGRTWGECSLGVVPLRTPSKYCAVTGAIVPMILREMVTAARYLDFWQSRSDHERVRIAVQDGRVKVWSEAVVTDHRNRFQGPKDDNPHDLSGLRTRAASGVGGGALGAPAT